MIIPETRTVGNLNLRGNVKCDKFKTSDKRTQNGITPGDPMC